MNTLSKEQKLTPEQTAIIASSGDIKINAVAGSGKTTTIIAYAASRPKNAKILYLAFNRSVKLEAAKKFAAIGLSNVKIETAHSLAYKAVCFSNNYNLKQQGYKTFEIVDIIGFGNDGDKHTKYIIANHINKFFTYYCNSDKTRIEELNYMDTIFDNTAKAFVKKFYPQIEHGMKLLFEKMDSGEIDITHDFYLKKFQLSNPRLHYDYILFDEAQDASAAMLDVLMEQKSTKVIVGDIHQQIYSWRYAVNSLEKTNFKTFHLTTSFRFPQDIAELAAHVLDWKKMLKASESTIIIGKGTETRQQSKAVIARTNLGLLLAAIDYITSNKKTKGIYFEGNINSYTYADEGASLYDVLNLHNGKYDRINDKLIRSMRDMKELDEYIEKTEDVQLGMMSGIVKEYGDEIYGMIRSLKDLHIEGDDKTKAEVIFSTVHRAKGMEYDVVHLADDFIKESRLQKLISEHKNEKGKFDLEKLNEEINLLYVAITRARYKLYIPENLIPASLISGRNIIAARDLSKRSQPAKTYNLAGSRQTHQDAYQPWTGDLDAELTNRFNSDMSIKELADHFGRTKGSIVSRLKKLGLY